MGKDRNRLVEERNRLTEERNNLTEEAINHLVLEVKNVLLTDALFLGKATDSQLMLRIKETIDQRSGQYNIGMNDRERIARRVFARLRGLGILDELLADESVTEIMVNGAKHIFVERAGKIYRVSRTFESEEELYNITSELWEKQEKK